MSTRAHGCRQATLTRRKHHAATHVRRLSIIWGLARPLIGQVGTLEGAHRHEPGVLQQQQQGAPSCGAPTRARWAAACPHPPPLTHAALHSVRAVDDGGVGQQLAVGLHQLPAGGRAAGRWLAAAGTAAAARPPAARHAPPPPTRLPAASSASGLVWSRRSALAPRTSRQSARVMAELAILPACRVTRAVLFPTAYSTWQHSHAAAGAVTGRRPRETRGQRRPRPLMAAAPGG